MTEQGQVKSLAAPITLLQEQSAREKQNAGTNQVYLATQNM